VAYSWSYFGGDLSLSYALSLLEGALYMYGATAVVELLLGASLVLGFDSCL
jgi:hypothetical protein